MQEEKHHCHLVRETSLPLCMPVSDSVLILKPLSFCSASPAVEQLCSHKCVWKNHGVSPLWSGMMKMDFPRLAFDTCNPS